MDPELELLPGQLVKYYKHEEHAEQLVRQGQLRVHLVEYFQKIEDPARQDRDEGEGRLKVPGQVPRVWISTQDGSITDRDEVEGHFNWGTKWIHPTYVYCTSLPDVSKSIARVKFGPYPITITNPALFARRLIEAFRGVDFGESEPLFLKGFPVQYSKDVISELPTDWRRYILGFGQKPAVGFEEDHEYRFACALSRPDLSVPAYLDLQLESPGEFCERGAPD